MLLLDNPIQHYAWGSRTELAALLGRPAADQPEAELWIGAHPRAPSRTSSGHTLLEQIRSDPESMLGPATRQRFGAELPFLLKVLAVDAPLSLQAHPNLEQARRGFAREQAAGIPLDAPERTYKDAQHKPELICALSPFEALSGFRPPADTLALFHTLGLGELDLVKDLAAPGGEPLRAGFSHLMALTGDARAALLAQVLGRCEQAALDPGPFQASYRWAVELGRAYPGDTGAVASLLLQHVSLAPLEALYLGAGSLHAYLHGTGVEIMANSDNVLRGGLTPKHVDVPELLRVLRFESAEATKVSTRAGTASETCYLSPASEFALSRFELTLDTEPLVAVKGPELLLCVEGQLRIWRDGTSAARAAPGSTAGSSTEETALRKGQACFVPASSGAYRLRGAARLFRAQVGS